MRLWWLALLAASCADDYGLDVDVHNPSDIAVERTVVSVYEGAVTCGEIELGDVDDAELGPALSARTTIVEGETPSAPLAGVSRRERKVIVARAYGPDQDLLASGCTEVGEITGHEHVTVTTELAARVSVAFVDRASDPTSLEVVTVGPDGRLLDGRAVSWRVYAPVGASAARTTGVTAEVDAWSAAAPSCTDAGRVTIHVVPPSTAGGYVIQPRVAWAVTRSPLLSSINVDPVPAELGLVPGVRHPCAIGRSTAGARLVCLTAADTLSVFAVGSDGALGTPSTSMPGFNPVGVYAAPDGTDLAVFAVGAGGELARVFPTPGARTCMGCGLFAIDDVIALPACGSGGAKAIVHTAGSGVAELRWVDAGGGAMTAFPFAADNGTTSRLRTAGCASAIDATSGVPSVVAAALIEPRSGVLPMRPRLAFDCTASGCQELTLPLAGPSVGFTVDAQPALLVPTLDAGGVVVTHSVLVREASETTLLELSRQPAATLPDRLLSAQLDDDGIPDTVWNVEVAGRIPALQVGYAREVEGAPLAAIGLLQRSANVALIDMLADDLTGDGHDDIVLVSTSLNDGQLGLTVIATGIPVDGGSTTPVDPTCP